jgi:oxygen-independent coproporphyrinogen III oxidase
MDPALIRRFEDRRIPRYTSYPTAPHFSPAIGPAACRDWMTALDPAARVSLYVHVPFCTSLCWYCGCHTKVPGHDEPIDRYVEALEQEIALVADRLPGRMQVGHLHWGGGTPTIIGPARFERLMAQIYRRFAIAEDAELAIEIDPRRLTREMVASLAACSINRVSLGVQSFDPDVQRAINRIQSFEMTQEAVEALRGAGIDRLNFDLIYGLPQQSVASCESTVARALALRPDRLAVFGYAHVPALKRHQQRIDATTLPDAAQRFAQAETIATALCRSGYTAIGLDHFALPEDGLARALAARELHRNFQGYTTDRAETLIGLGASSIGAFAQGYVQNTPQIGAWQEAVAEGRLATARGLVLRDNDRLRRGIIEQLMCYLEVDLAAEASRYGVDSASFVEENATLADLAAQGVVRLAGDRVIVNEDCRMLTRIVAAVFDTYLDAAAGRHAKAI